MKPPQGLEKENGDYRRKNQSQDYNIQATDKKWN